MNKLNFSLWNHALSKCIHFLGVREPHFFNRLVTQMWGNEVKVTYLAPTITYGLNQEAWPEEHKADKISCPTLFGSVSAHTIYL